MTPNTRPPRSIEALLRCALAHTPWAETAVGDLREEFAAHAARRGRFAASIWYSAEAARMLLRVAARAVRALVSAGGPDPMTNLAHDVRHAARRLRRTPAFTGFAVAILALGIGATTAVYSVVYAVALRPLDIPHIDRVVNVYHSKPPGSGPMIGFSWPDYEDLRAQQTVFSQLVAWERFQEVVSGRSLNDPVVGEMVGGDYFTLVGARAERGRLLQTQDDRPGAPPVAVVSDAFWVERLGADPHIIGGTLRIKGTPFQVVGVVAPPFRGVFAPNVAPTPVWVPLSAAPVLDVPPAYFSDREDRWLFVKGRLRPGVTLAQAQAQITTIARRLDASFPIGQDYPTHARFEISRPWYLMPASSVHLQDSTPSALPLAVLVMVLVGLVLLVAASNLANLMLARGANRAHETAVRYALGASRWRLLREDLIESGLVAAAGGGAGLLFARWLTLLLSSNFSVAPGLVVKIEPSLNAPVLGLAAGATLGALLVFGLVPAWRAPRGDVRRAVHASGSGATGRWRGRRLAIAFQVAVSALLLALTALAVDQARRTMSHDPGFEYAHLAGASVNFTMTGEPEARGRQVMAEVLSDARAGAGVESAALATGLPAGRLYLPLSATTPPEHGFGNGRAVAWPRTLTVSPGALVMLGIPLRRGRAFTEHDGPDAQPVAIVSETLATEVFGSVNVVGRALLAHRQQSVADTTPPPVETLTIVGVAADTDVGSMGVRRSGLLYRPYAQHYDPTIAAIVRTAGDPTPLVDTLRHIVARADPQALVYDAGTGTHLADAENVGPKVIGALTGLLGGFALLVALAGLYGVLSHLVARRRREIGVRIALGADRRRIMFMILADGLRPVAGGLVVGLAASALVLLALRAFVLGFPPTSDVWVLAFVPAPFAVASAIACLLPARRAARVDPNEALREL